MLGQEFNRWISFDAWTLTTRYRYVRANSGAEIASHQQWQLNFRPRLKLDPKGKYSVAAVLATGNNFTSGYNNTGVGTGRGETNLYVKQLYLDARPTRHVEIQFGGVGFNTGENTEVTTFDADGYMTGERLIIRAPKKLWFDEVSVTNGYVGDVDQPSIFRRVHRLDESNYRQLLFRKQVTKRVGFSADHTYLRGADLIHQAVRVKPTSAFFSTLLFEAYERVSSPGGYGFNVFAERAASKRLAISGGFARIDKHLTLNADRFPPGKRLYLSAVYKLSPELSLTPFLIQGIGRLAAPGIPRTRLDVLFTWNVLETLRRHRVL